MSGEIEPEGNRSHSELKGIDIDGDGVTSPWEVHLCKLCLLGAIAIAFGDKLM